MKTKLTKAQDALYNTITGRGKLAVRDESIKGGVARRLEAKGLIKVDGLEFYSWGTYKTYVPVKQSA